MLRRTPLRFLPPRGPAAADMAAEPRRIPAVVVAVAATTSAEADEARTTGASFFIGGAGPEDRIFSSETEKLAALERSMTMG